MNIRHSERTAPANLSGFSEKTYEQATRLTGAFVATAQRTADYYARKLTRTLDLPVSGVEDIRQDLLLEMLIRSVRFDPERAAWITFVDLIMRHGTDALIARLISERQVYGGFLDDLLPSSDGSKTSLAETVADTEGMDSLWSAPKDPFAAVELAIDIDRFLDGLPEHLRHLCRLLMKEPPMGAQRLSGLSVAQFYRHLNELRMRLRVLGLGARGTP